MDLDLSQFRDAFLDECDENASEIEAGLLQLESAPDDGERVHALFRAAHSIKGGSGTFDLLALEQLTHAMENVFGAMREARVPVDADRVTLLLRATDGLRLLLADARAEGTATAESELLTALTAAESVDAHASPPATSAPATSAPAPSTPAPAATPPVSAPPGAASPDSASPGTAEAAHGASSESRSTLRVATEKVDELVNLVGELVIAQAAVRRQFDALQPQDAEDLATALDHSQVCLHELQQRALSVRMVPVGTLFGRLSRVVRDAAENCDKQVALIAEGGDTELDKTIVDALAEPLTHLVRNAIDHGVEDAARRTARGKSPKGSLRLSASYDGGAVLVEIADDGQGLDGEAILRRAQSAGLLAPGQEPTDDDLHELIFAPGFSTAEQVTEMSGRGVGLDVVRNHVTSMNGSVTVHSAPGQGTTFRLRLPLTLAIIDGLLVGVGDRTYVLPVNDVVETMRPTAAELRTVLGRGTVIMLRDEPLPLLSLGHLLGRHDHDTTPLEGLAVIVEHAGERSALHVDRLLDRQEFVIRNLETHYARVEGLMGGAVMGDGSIALILDVGGLQRLHRHAAPQHVRDTPAEAHEGVA